jgi:hypothetical protein
MGNVDQALFELVAVQSLAAGASHDAVRPLLRQQFASLPQLVFPRRPVALISPFVKIGLGALRQEHAPCAFKGNARLVEGGRGAGSPVAGLGAWIESRSAIAIDQYRPGCPSGARSSQRAHRHRESAGSIVWHQDRGGG